MKLSDEQIQDLLRVGNPTDEECRLIRTGWDAALARMRTQGVPDGWKLVPIVSTHESAMLAAAPEAKPSAPNASASEPATDATEPVADTTEPEAKP